MSSYVSCSILEILQLRAATYELWCVRKNACCFPAIREFVRLKVVVNNKRNTTSVMGNEPSRVYKVLIRESTVEALCGCPQ